MKDIELPPPPSAIHNRLNDYAKAIVTKDQDARGDALRQLEKAIVAYASAAVEADRAQRVPDGLTLAVIGNKHFGNPIPGKWYAAAKELLASTPAQPTQTSGWSEEFGLVLEAANRVELACYEQGSAECMAAVRRILDGKDRGEGVANEPWESIRRRLIALVAPAQPAQQELEKALEPRMSRACLDAWDKSEFTAGHHDAVHPMFLGAFSAGFKAAAQHQEPPQPVERKPMTDELLAREASAAEVSAVGLEDSHFADGFVSGFRRAERHHGIKE